MLRRLLSTVSCLGLAERMRLGLWRDGDTFKTQCPVCQQAMWILEHSFVCSNQTCQFFSGGPLDLLKAAEGLPSYTKAIQRMSVIYEDRSDSWTNVPLEEALPVMAREARVRREILDMFLRSYWERKLPSTSLVYQVRGWLERDGFLESGTDMSLFVFTPPELEALQNCLSRLGAPAIEIPEYPLVVLPYFSDHHTVAALVLYDYEQQRHQQVVLQKTRFSYFGLLHHNPGKSVLHMVGPSHFEAARINSAFSLSGTEHLALSVRMDSTVEDCDFIPAAAIYHSPKGEHLSTAEQLRLHCPQMLFTADSPEPRLMGDAWEDYLFHQIISGCYASGNLRAGTRTMLGSLRLDAQIRQRLIKRLFKEGKVTTGGELQRIFQTNLIYESDKLRLYAAPEGYQVLKTKAAGRDSLTNFIIELNSNVVFRETGVLYYSGRLVYEGEDFPVMLSAREIDVPAEVEAAVQRVVIQRSANTASMPVIRDRMLFKHVAAHLRDVSAKLDHKEGLENLGWSVNRHLFYGPFWKTTMDGTAEVDFCFHPGVPLLGSFTAEKRNTPVLPEDRTHPAVRDMIAMLLACVARGYLNYPTRGVMIRQDAESQVLLEGLFHELGQVQGVRRGGTELSGSLGYPLYGYGYNSRQLEQLGLPIFSLSQAGLVLAHAATSQELASAGAFIRKSMVQVAEWLLASGGEGYTRKPHVLHSSELIDEGSWLLNHVLGETWDLPVLPFSATEKLLSSTPSDKIGERWKYDFAQQKVRLLHQGLPVDLPWLEVELRSLCHHMVVHAEFIEMDSISATDLLRHYYGRQPDLPAVRR